MKRLTQKQHTSVTHRSMGPQTIWWNRKRYNSLYMYKSPYTHTHTNTQKYHKITYRTFR